MRPLRLAATAALLLALHAVAQTDAAKPKSVGYALIDPTCPPVDKQLLDAFTTGGASGEPCLRCCHPGCRLVSARAPRLDAFCFFAALPSDMPRRLLSPAAPLPPPPLQTRASSPPRPSPPPWPAS